MNLKPFASCSRNTRKPPSSVWVSVLAGCLAGWLAAPCSAETVTLPDPLSTNLYTTVEAWVDLETVPTLVLTEEQRTDWLNRLYYIVTYTREDAVAFYYEIYNLTNDIHDYLSDFEQNADFPADISDEFIEQWETLVDDVNFRLNLYQQDAYAFIAGVTNQIEVVDRIVTEIGDLPYTNVIKSVSLGQQYGYTQGGACHCPDYTSYLQGLQDELQDFHDYFYNLFGWVEQFHDGLVGGRISSDYTAGSLLAEIIATAGLALRQESGQSWDVSQRLREWVQWHFVYPTNTVEHPLYIATDTGVVLNVALDGVTVTNGALSVSVGNFDELTNSLASVLQSYREVVKVDERREVESAQEEADAKVDRLEDEDDTTFGETVGEFEYFRSFRSLRDALDNLTTICDGFGEGLPEVVLWEEFTLDFSEAASAPPAEGDEDPRKIEVSRSVVNLSGNRQYSWLAGWIRRVSHFVWLAVGMALDWQVAAWLVRLCGAGLSVLFAVISGDLSSLAEVVPKLADALGGRQ